jgi:hypothetical protein
VRRKAIISKISQPKNQTTIPEVYKFSNKLWDFKSQSISKSIAEILWSNLEINEKMRRGLENIEIILDNYLDLLNISIKSYLLTIYGSVIIENGAIICATNKYHNKSWFSDVEILMNSEELFDYKTDEGSCYGQVTY